MNHHMQAGTGPPHMPMHPHHHSRRQQDFTAYHQQPPQSPMHPYAAYPHPQYYQHQQQYQSVRWQHHNPYQQQPLYMQHPAVQQVPPPPPPPPPSMPYQPRSPIVVSSTPYGQAMPPLGRQVSNTMTSTPMQASNSPRPIPQHPMHQQQPLAQQYHHPHQPQTPQQIYTPAAPPSPAPTPKQEQGQMPPNIQHPDTPSNPETVPAKVVQPTHPTVVSPLSLPPEFKTPFYPSLPWYSNEDGPSSFPRRESSRRKRRQLVGGSIEPVALPVRGTAGEPRETTAIDESSLEASTIAGPSDFETPASSQAPSESDFTQVSTPLTPAQPIAASPKFTPTATSSQSQTSRRDTRTAIAVPNIADLMRSRVSPPILDQPRTPAGTEPIAVQEKALDAEASEVAADAPTPAPAKPAPKSWAELVRRNAPYTAAARATTSAFTGAVSPPKSASLADALRQFDVKGDLPLSFLEPRGLVNTGNMCYMNSILQILVFCVPFYNFLEQVQQRTVHHVKSETPLVDAMILFMREFKVLAVANSAKELKPLLNQQQLEQYGEPITPAYVYDTIRKLERFQSMRRGHQQDAEEFLGFLLEGLHDECVAVMQRGASETPQQHGANLSSAPMSPTSTDGWLEVGPKQKASITRQAGNPEAPSPITKIFGGTLRSELRVTGLKDSVTLEQYKPLQLDIGASHVNNIIDALKGLTRTESLTGDFGGRSNTAKKQVFIDALPPVLILHLKRFQYENNLTGTQKIWKKVGYPLELEIPKEVFPPSKRGGFAVKGGLPSYRLTAVVYHHGKSAAGGHYTVDVLRQDGREWVRMDDTIIRRIRPEDVAEGGAEEDPKILARALEQHKADQEFNKQRNLFSGLDDVDDDAAAAAAAAAAEDESKPWSEVNGTSASQSAAVNQHHRKLNSITGATNGTATPTSAGKRTPTAARKDAFRDNKVAYILLYERINA